jgi:L-lactate dehydrogenase (cytochrome)/(S)-mandelate dehydrogenase
VPRRPLLEGFRFDLTGRTRPASVDDYRLLAQRRLPRKAWTVIENGADDEVTLRRNRSDFERWTLRQRVLQDVVADDLGVEIAGTRLSLPVALSSPGLLGFYGAEAELGAARAAEACGTRHTCTMGSAYSLEELRDGTRENHWFQLYPWRSREFIGAFLDEVLEAGYGALFVTVDVPVVGNREGERRVGWLSPDRMITGPDLLQGILHPRYAYDLLTQRRAWYGIPSVRRVVHEGDLLRPGLLSWDTLAWIRERWRDRPLFVKGITDADDAVRAVDGIGCDGVLVSNHGGRQLDSQTSTIAALPAVVDAVGDRATVMIDGGIRRGTDVVKALCLGADLCMIGRPFIYGLAAAGERGVVDVIEILRREIRTTMTLMGCPEVSGLDRSWIAPADG